MLQVIIYYILIIKYMNYLNFSKLYSINKYTLTHPGFFLDLLLKYGTRWSHEKRETLIRKRRETFIENVILMRREKLSLENAILTHLCRPVRSTFAVRETASLGIMGAPQVPSLNPSESIVLSAPAAYPYCIYK